MQMYDIVLMHAKKKDKDYCSVHVEIVSGIGDVPKVIYSVYVDDYEHYKSETFEGALNQFLSAAQIRPVFDLKVN